MLGLRPSIVVQRFSQMGSVGFGETVLNHPVPVLRDVLLPLVAGPAIPCGVLQFAVGAPFLCAFGRRLEARGGSFAFAGLYLLGGVLACAAEVLVHADGQVPMLGASGAVSAVMGGHLALYWRSRMLVVIPVVVVPVVCQLPVFAVVVTWLALQFEPIQRLFMVGQCAPFSYVGVVAGLVGGAALAPLLMGRRTTGAAA